MKGTFTLQNDTVQIEEFSYPLEEFLRDEPDFKVPKSGELIYHRGQGSTLIIAGKQSEAEKDYPKRGYRTLYRSQIHVSQRPQGTSWCSKAVQGNAIHQKSSQAYSR